MQRQTVQSVLSQRSTNHHYDLTTLYLNHLLNYGVDESTYPLSIHDDEYDSIEVETRNKESEIYIMNYNNFVINDLKQNIETNISNFVLNAIKNKFGKEFLFTQRDMNLIDHVTNKFIRRFDKKIDTRVTKTFWGFKNKLINVQYIIPVDKGTFIYVASGNKISNIKQRYMMDDTVSSFDLYLYIFGKKSKKYINLLNTILQKFMSKNELGIYIVDQEKYNTQDQQESLEVIYSSMKPRYLETMFFSHGEKESICEHINKFLSNNSFYYEKQLLYKTGILLYGEPGTGKSSLVKALATTYERHIVSINMSNIKHINLNKLAQSINVDEQKYIILLEDIDTVFLNRNDNNTDKEDREVINKLLQFLDSNTSPNNVIFIATTNHIERLDSALLREGRFDLKVEVKPLKLNDAMLFGKSFGLKEYAMNEIIDNIDKEFNRNDLYNQSMLQTRILGKLENKSLEVIQNIYKETGE